MNEYELTWEENGEKLTKRFTELPERNAKMAEIVDGEKNGKNVKYICHWNNV